MRPWNFSAGPAALPLEVLQQAAAEMTDWHGTSLSVMEMSHRGKHFIEICTQAEEDLRTLLEVPDNFAVLFMQGGATAQNALLPLNLIGRNGRNKADYVLSGSWSVKSYKEGQRYGDMAVAASSEQPQQLANTVQGPWTWFPKPDNWAVRADAAYVHMCSNETIGGVEYVDWPDLVSMGYADVPLVVDASSHLLSRPVDFSRAAVVYAGAQKNIGPAGLTLVIIRQDLLGHALPACPQAFDFAKVAEADSRFNTPPTYSIYIAGLVFQWLKKLGGVRQIEQINRAKANLLYNYLDSTAFYNNPVDPAVRSRMNIPFLLSDRSLDTEFLKQADEAGLLQLKGHKSVGGMRASLYNAMPLEGVQALVSFMQEFERRYG